MNNFAQPEASAASLWIKPMIALKTGGTEARGIGAYSRASDVVLIHRREGAVVVASGKDPNLLLTGYMKKAAAFRRPLWVKS